MPNFTNLPERHFVDKAKKLSFGDKDSDVYFDGEALEALINNVEDLQKPITTDRIADGAVTAAKLNENVLADLPQSGMFTLDAGSGFTNKKWEYAKSGRQVTLKGRFVFLNEQHEELIGAANMTGLPFPVSGTQDITIAANYYGEAMIVQIIRLSGTKIQPLYSVHLNVNTGAVQSGSYSDITSLGYCVFTYMCV